MSSITDRVLRGTLWVSLARVAVNFFALVSTFMLAWFLTPQDFGLVAIASTVIFVTSVATELSLTTALVRHASPDESHLNAAWTLNATRSLGICLFTCAISWPIASVYNDQRLVPVLCIFGSSLFISGLANPRMAIAQRDLQFRPDFIVQTGQKLVGLTVSFAWAYTFRDHWALVVGSVATQVANVLLSYIVLPYRPRILFRHFREFFSFSGWLLASQIVNTMNWRFDQLLVGKMFGPHVLGFYSMGSNLAQLPTREALAPLIQPLFPAFVAVRHDLERLASAYLRAQAIVTAVALPIGFGLSLIADPLVRLMLGEKWVESISVIQVLAAIGTLQSLASLVHALALSIDQTRIIFIRSSFILTLRIIVLIFSAKIFGIKGLLFGSVFIGLIFHASNMLIVYRIINLNIYKQIKSNHRAILATVVMALSVSSIGNGVHTGFSTLELVTRILVMIAFGAISYAGTLLVLWRLEGMPAGPEAEAWRLIQIFQRKMLARFRDNGLV